MDNEPVAQRIVRDVCRRGGTEHFETGGQAMSKRETCNCGGIIHNNGPCNLCGFARAGDGPCKRLTPPTAQPTAEPVDCDVAQWKRALLRAIREDALSQMGLDELAHAVLFAAEESGVPIIEEEISKYVREEVERGR